MFEAIVIGGSEKGSFVLDSKYITKIRIHSKSHTAEIWFHTAPTFQWFIQSFGTELENPESIWARLLIKFEGVWHLHFDTNYIPICIS